MRKLLFLILISGLVASFATGCTPAVGAVEPAPAHRVSAHGDSADEGEELVSEEPALVATQGAEARAGDGDEWTVAVVSDLNGSYGSTDYHEEVESAVDWIIDDVEPDAVVSTGDMVAGQKQGLDYEAMWRAFHDAVTDPLTRADIPFAVTPGNHDASAGSVYVEERITYVEQWRERRPELRFVDDSFYPLHYAFEIGPALFVSLDATTTGPLDDEQMAWLDEVLTEHEESEFKIVFGHVPLYPFSEERKDEILGDQSLEHLLREHDVDMMLSGHHHAYYPGKRDDLRLVGMSCLGSGSRTLIGDDKKSAKSVAVLRFSADGDLSVDAFDALDHAHIERESLPPHLNSGPRRIWRDDVDQVAGR